MTTSCRPIASRLAGVSIATTFLVIQAGPASAASFADAASGALGFAVHSIVEGYRAAPALMLGLAVLCLLPLLAISGRLYAIRRQRREAPRDAGPSDEDVSLDTMGDRAALPGHAFVEIIGVNNARYAILRDMLRIGREDDNDIRIPSRGIDRYHAAIHREDLADWWITDLSGRDGNGVVVNGQRCGDARLRDGDVIELGPGRLKFHAGCH